MERTVDTKSFQFSRKIRLRFVCFPQGQMSVSGVAQKGLRHAISYLFIKRTLLSYQLNSKNNGPVFLFKYFLPSIATDGKNGHGLKVEKVFCFIFLIIILPKSTKYTY